MGIVLKPKLSDYNLLPIPLIKHKMQNFIFGYFL